MAVLYLTWKDRWCQQKVRDWKKKNKKGDPNFLFKIDIKQIFKDFMVIMAELKMFLEPEPWPNSAKLKYLKLNMYNKMHRNPSFIARRL